MFMSQAMVARLLSLEEHVRKETDKANAEAEALAAKRIEEENQAKLLREQGAHKRKKLKNLLMGRRCL